MQSTEGWLLARASFYRLCPHYIGQGFYLPATPKGDEHSLSTQEGEEKEYLSSCEDWRPNIFSLLLGTDPDRNRVTWETPSSEAIPFRQKLVRRTHLLRDPAQTQV